MTPRLVDFEELSSGEQAIFRQAVQADDRTARADGEELSGQLLPSPTRVRYNGDIYEVTATITGMRAEYGATARATAPESIGADARVVPYRNLSDQQQRVFPRVVNGTANWTETPLFADCPPGECYIRYDGTHYSVTGMVADIPRFEIAVKRIEPGM